MRAPFSGGALGTHSGESVNSGGARGGPKGAFFFQGAHLLNWGAPKTIKNPLSFILFSPLWDFGEIVQKGPKGATQQGRIQGGQGGSQMGPKGPSGVPGGGQGGPRGPKGPSRGSKGAKKEARPSLALQTRSRNGLRGVWGVNPPGKLKVGMGMLLRI